MSLGLIDAIRLSTSSIIEHKGRSAVTILTVATLFGVLMALNFLLNGIEKTALAANMEQTHEAVYVTTQAAYHANRFEETQEGEARLGSFEPMIADQDVTRITTRAAEFNGEVVGTTWAAQMAVPYHVVNLSAVQDFVEIDLADVPEGHVPVLATSDFPELTGYDELDAHLAEVLYPVGHLPSTISFDDPEHPERTVGWPVLGDSPLNLLLQNISNVGDTSFMLVDDGSGKIENFLRAEAISNGQINPMQIRSALVVRFAELDDAVRYVFPANFLGIPFEEIDARYVTADFIGGVLSTTGNFNNLKATLTLVEIALIVVAVIIATMTFRHLVDTEAATVALYRSIGATTGEIYLIYFLYILELVMLALIACLVLAFVIVGVIALLNGEALGALLQEYYRMPNRPKLYFYSFNQYFWTTVIAVLLVAPLTFGLSTHCFSEKYVARKLKED